MIESTPILMAVDLQKSFRVSSTLHSNRLLRAVDGVSLQLMTGETLGIAGESGCGKSTLAKIAAGIMTPDSGELFYKGELLSKLGKSEWKNFRVNTQMIFQDPFSSLNPRMKIGDSISEPLKIAGASLTQQQIELRRIMDAVGLSANTADRFPDEFSGGQRQRIVIARALIASPEIVIADEPVSSLDISIQAQIINLLMQMKKDFALSMIFISHNLMVLRHICDRIIIMYLGAIVEVGRAEDILNSCKHPYTEALIAAIPGLQTNNLNSNKQLKGDLPTTNSVTSGCRFHPRCPYTMDKCRNEIPLLTESKTGHAVACHLSCI
ncbi:MAG: ATP-binding cassette domain-containing protein [Desulfuromonadaceae bacterium]|nr:ATP-binding cassette domain-containing protein [Desulfuromonadaceae bacterium]MDD2855451.1 ATP-binding cassette domain-containing protein [Desulfuromonadaceae bacterium]